MSSSSVAPIFAGRRRRRSCCSSPICGSARHATSSTIGSAESRSRDLCCCIASSLHLSSASPALGYFAWHVHRRFRRHCLFCARLLMDSEWCMATWCACAVHARIISHLIWSRCSALRVASQRLQGDMLSGQIVHRDVKGLNILLKEMRGYFETCICDFGAQSNSNSHGQRRGRSRACRQALRGSRTS